MTRHNRRAPHIGLSMEQIPGFALADTPVGLGLARVAPAQRPAPQARASVREAVTYTAYHERPTPCYEGVRLTHLGQAGAHLTHARYRRKFRGEETLMCGPCTQTWHAADGLTSPLPNTTRTR